MPSGPSKRCRKILNTQWLNLSFEAISPILKRCKLPLTEKKLIEVDIPLDAINHESARDASLTSWPPFNAASDIGRVVRSPHAVPLIFASMVDDPSVLPRPISYRRQSRIAERK